MNMPITALYEGLAEEAAELSAAASKAARIFRGDNPTPVTFAEAYQKIREEFTDLLIYVNDIGIAPSNDIYLEKLQREKNRRKSSRDEEIKI